MISVYVFHLYLFRYAPIDGIPSFIKASLELVYEKDNKLLTDAGMHVAAAQCISGTGGLRIIFELLNLLSVKFGRSNTIYMPNPTWPNHLGRVFQMEEDIYKVCVCRSGE